MQTQENPELLLIARMIEALVLQLQNKPEGADAQISDAWQAYYAARRKHGAG